MTVIKIYIALVMNVVFKYIYCTVGWLLIVCRLLHNPIYKINPYCWTLSLSRTRQVIPVREGLGKKGKNKLGLSCAKLSTA